MNASDLHLIPAATGQCLNPEEHAAVQTSLLLLRSAENLAGGVQLWGKVLGVDKDYLVAEGRGEDLLLERKFFYSLDGGASWVHLPAPSAADVKRAPYIYQRFLGDPAFEAKPAKADAETDDSPMNEEKRLAATIAAINHDAVVVPRGAYYKNAMQKIRPNDLFHGLGKSEATHLSSYLHFRAPAGAVSQVRQVPDETLDIFEPAELDQPKGSYAVKQEQGGKLVTIKSAHWPGYTAYHSLTTGQHGWVYMGTGQRNHDIGFQL